MAEGVHIYIVKNKIITNNKNNKLKINLNNFINNKSKMRLKARKKTLIHANILENNTVEPVTESNNIGNEDNMLFLEILIDNLNTDFTNILSTNNCLKRSIDDFSRKKEILSNFIKTGYNCDMEKLNEHSSEILEKVTTNFYHQAIDYAENFITKLVKNFAQNSKFIFENINSNENVQHNIDEEFIDSLSNSISKEFNEQEQDFDNNLKIENDESEISASISYQPYDNEQYDETDKNEDNYEDIVYNDEEDEQYDGYTNEIFENNQTTQINDYLFNEANIFSCNLCEKKFSRKENLSRHRKTHGNEKQFECKFCNIKFTRKQNLKRHIKIHTGENLFNCELCDKKFSRKDYLVTHLKHHSNDKPFECQLCSKKFTHKNDLSRHEFTHSGQKPFECEICQKSFIEKSHLLRHYKTRKHIMNAK